MDPQSRGHGTRTDGSTGRRRLSGLPLGREGLRSETEESTLRTRRGPRSDLDLTHSLLKGPGREGPEFTWRGRRTSDFRERPSVGDLRNRRDPGKERWDEPKRLCTTVDHF